MRRVTCSGGRGTIGKTGRGFLVSRGRCCAVVRVVAIRRGACAGGPDSVPPVWCAPPLTFCPRRFSAFRHLIALRRFLVTTAQGYFLDVTLHRCGRLTFGCATIGHLFPPLGRRALPMPDDRGCHQLSTGAAGIGRLASAAPAPPRAILGGRHPAQAIPTRCLLGHRFWDGRVDCIGFHWNNAFPFGLDLGFSGIRYCEHLLCTWKFS